MFCKICNTECIRYTKHLKKHGISPKDYYDKYIKSPNEDICKCGKQLRFINPVIGYTKICQSCAASITQTKRYLNPIERQKDSERMKAYYQNEDNRKLVSKRQIEVMKDINLRKRISESVKNSEKFQSAIHSKEYSENMHNILTERYKIAENRIKMSESCKNSTAVQESKRTSEFRQKHSKLMAERINRGEHNVRYKFNEVTFMSLPEFAFYLYLTENKIEFEYQCKPIQYKSGEFTRSYIPDFKINGIYYELKGSQFFKDGHLYNPFNKTYDLDKENCMKDNNVVILTKEKYSKYVDWLYYNYTVEFIESHRCKNTKSANNGHNNQT